MGTVSRRRSRSFFPRVSSRIPRLPGGEGRENDLRVKLAGFMTRDKRGRRGGGGRRKETRTLSSHFAAIDYPLFPERSSLSSPPLHSYTYTFESASPRSKTTPVLSILRFITRRKAKVSGTRWNVRFVNWNGTFSREKERERVRRKKKKKNKKKKGKE